MLHPDIGTANWDEQYTYYLTPLVGSGDYMPATLYFDKDGDGLDASDSPVYVDFKGKYQHPTHFGGDWDETPTTSLEGTYPSIWANLVLASEIDSGDCSVNDYWSCPTRATWDSSAFRWNRGYYLLDSDNAVYAFSSAIFATFTNDAATDANANAQNMTVTVAEGDWNDLLGEQCATSGGCEVAMDLSLLDGQPIRVRYDGQRVNWLPGMRDSERDEWFRIVNPADGTVVTDTDGNRYVLKTLSSDQLLIGESDTSACEDAGLVFSGLLDGHTLDDLPDVWDNDNYPRPTLVWSDQPELPDGYCTVQDGVSDCD